MPAIGTRQDRFNLDTDSWFRTCSSCSTESPLDRTNFFHRDRADGTTWIDGRCDSCRRQRDAETRAARRAGRSIRGTRQTDGRRFGVEIEFIGSDYRALIREMEARGLRVAFEGYTHRIRAGAWKIVTDASISAGYELVSPPLRGAAGIAQVEKACEALVAAGMRVNRSCGLHVHHDVSDLDAPAFGRMYRGWALAQRATDWFVAASRRNSNWARPLVEREIQRVEQLTRVERSTVQALYIDRYRALNVACFARYGTVEVRQHQGTINARKVIAWIRFGQAMIARAVAVETLAPFSSPHELADDLVANGGLDAATATYLKARAVSFGVAAPVAEQVAA